MPSSPDTYERIWLLTTCGTSVLSNGPEKDLRTWLTDNANAPSLSEDHQYALDGIIATRQNTLRRADTRTLRRLSAELNGVEAVRERWAPTQIHHLLLHTDTALGRASAALVQDVLRAQGQSTQLLTFGGLRTDSLANFRAAVSDLAGELIRDHLAQARADGWRIVFNLTGGFKSLNAWLQGLGTLYADRCVFIFEGPSELLELPQLPIDRSNIAVGEVRSHPSVFRRLAMGYPVRHDEAAHIADSLLLADGDRVVTSLWGDIAWAEARPEIFARTLLDPLSPRVRLSQTLLKDFEKIESRHRVHVNDALDAFSAYLDHGRALGKANSFKMLQGDPAPGSTHELYAWSDGSAGRLLGHFDAKSPAVFVVDHLVPHL